MRLGARASDKLQRRASSGPRPHRGNEGGLLEPKSEREAKETIAFRPDDRFQSLTILWGRYHAVINYRLQAYHPVADALYPELLEPREDVRALSPEGCSRRRDRQLTSNGIHEDVLGSVRVPLLVLQHR